MIEGGGKDIDLQYSVNSQILRFIMGAIFIPHRFRILCMFYRIYCDASREVSCKGIFLGFDFWGPLDFYPWILAESGHEEGPKSVKKN